ncbi:MAG: integrin alpha, partial [Anaerolineae bacterium]|nr:integrin alpha [Anaerolineae bacterium]
GEAAGDRYGYAVGSAGDVNSDGYADVAIGAPGFGDDLGKVYVFRGSPLGLVEAAGWTASGESAGDLFGGSVATAGDANADGFDDLVVGAPGVDRSKGEVYIYYGSATGLSDTPDWMAGGENAGDRFGGAVGAAGDVNGDGVADLAVGAYSYPTGSSYGKVYVYHGSDLGLSASASWITVGENAGDRFGQSIGTAGDVNGDGFDDLIVGAYGYDDSAGKAYVYHGSETGLEGTAAWTAYQYSADRRFGVSVGTAGDVNGDGYADVIVGGLGYDAGGSTNACRVYLYYGSVNGLSTSSDWRGVPRYADTYFGTAVGTAGDVNGDGYADVVIGAHGDNDFSGHIYVFLGGSTGLDGNYSYAAAWDAGGESAGDRFGSALGTAGDVNGDGFSDLIVGAYASGHNAGEAYVYHGAPEGLSDTAVFTATGAATWNYFGEAVGVAGDVNGDGYADVYVGAPSYPSWGEPGGVYVYHGSALGLSATPDWIGEGEGRGDFFGSAVGAAGDVNGDGYADLIVGAYHRPNWADQGKAYVYLGSPSGLSGVPVWSVSGENLGDRFGRVVGTAGDVNGDGFSDVVVGAPNNGGTRGKIYVYLGTTTGLDASPAWTATGESNLYLGNAVAAAGDVNGDGFADLVVGVYAYNYNRGQVDVYHGSASGLGDSPAWTDVGENT